MKKRIFKLLIIICLLCLVVLAVTACKGVKMTISFMVDGVEYATIDTAGNEMVTIPQNPTKDGYTFDGWYWDNGTWQRPFTANSLLNEPLTSNMSVYAKFVIDEQYNNLQGTEIKTSAFTVNGDKLSATVANSVETFSFINVIQVADGATFTVSYDIGGINKIPTKTVSLSIGNNKYYILVENGNDIHLYTVTLRRKPIYTVRFLTNGGSFCESQQVEESGFATPPTTAKAGYTFANWDYDFTQAITANTSITASWTANEYTVTYDVNGGVLTETEYTAIYDSAYTLAVPTREGHTFQGWYIDETEITDAHGQSISSWTYAEDKTATAHWSINSYNLTLSSTNSDIGTVTGGGTYDYGSSVTVTAANILMGYDWLGWYVGDKLVSTELLYTFSMPATDVVLTSKYGVSTEMSNFNFTSTPTTCTITGVKDKSVTEVTIPKYVYSIDEKVFSGCYITNVYYTGDIADWCNIEFGSSSSNPLQYARKFYIDNKLVTELVIPDTVTGLKPYAFYYCKNLTSVTIGNSVTFIGEFAFDGCSDLTSVTISDSVTKMGWGAFGGCTNLTSVYYTGDIAGWCSINYDDYSANPLHIAHNLYINNKLVTELTIPNTVTNIKRFTFRDCTSITSIAISSSVTLIDTFAFTYCINLTSITVDTNNKKFHSVNNCLIETATKTLVLGCKTSVIPSDGRIDTIGKYAFEGCSGLTSIAIPSTITKISNEAFYNCRGLTSITIPDTVIEIGRDAFNNCSNLTSVQIGNGVTTINSGVFSDCDRLTNVHMGNNVDTICSFAFNYCSGLTSIVIPSSVTQIENNAFNYCSGLTSIVIPISVTQIEYNAFCSCTGLTSVYYSGTFQDWFKIKIGENGYLKSATLYYYSETEPARAGNYWHYVDGVVTRW